MCPSPRVDAILGAVNNFYMIPWNGGEALGANPYVVQITEKRALPGVLFSVPIRAVCVEWV
ncbi:hypothetical protein GCM10010270_76340 [Streptomyces violaceus]|nr:hypothetical protein GCM10010270_76340 [Streptomyces janthinus]